MSAPAKQGRSRVSERVRRAVIARDGLRCVLCDREVRSHGPSGDDRLHLDHIIPWADGGPDTVGNLRVTCARCNQARPKPPARAGIDRPTWYSIAEAADYLGVNPVTIRRRIADGSLPGYRMGPRNIRIKSTDLDALLTPIVPGWMYP